MSDVLNEYIGKKEADSSFVSLKESGASVHVKRVTNIEIVSKLGFQSQEEKEVLRLTVVVDTSEGEREKFFDNASKRFAEELQKHGIKIGSSFDLIRNGLGAETRYVIANVKHDKPATPESAAAVMGGDAQPAASAQ